MTIVTTSNRIMLGIEQALAQALAKLDQADKRFNSEPTLAHCDLLVARNLIQDLVPAELRSRA
jgi:hypothetical protein